MKKVNIKLFAILYKLNQAITKRLEDMKKQIIEGSEKTFANYANVKVVACTRASYSKEAQAKLDKFAQDNGLEKIVSTYKRVEIDNISTEVDAVVDNIVNILEDSNDNMVKRVGSKIANIVK